MPSGAWVKDWRGPVGGGPDRAFWSGQDRFLDASDAVVVADLAGRIRAGRCGLLGTILTGQQRAGNALQFLRACRSDGAGGRDRGSGIAVGKSRSKSWLCAEGKQDKRQVAKFRG